MSNFLFKGIQLSNVINTTSGTTLATGYGFSYNTTVYANSNPLPVHYQINGTDIANTAAAYYTTHTNTTLTTYAVPTGANECRYVLRGGGGGSGGGGGAAIDFDGYLQYRSGGKSYGGTQGSISLGTISSISGTTYTIVVGSGGSGGTGGASRSSDSSGDGVTAKNGDPGVNGNSTIFNINSTAYEASGGTGGSGGTGAHAPAAGGGTGGTDGGGDNVAVALQSDWDPIVVGNAGTGKAGVAGGGYNTNNDNASAGSNGSQGNTGAAQIIWLYG